MDVRVAARIADEGDESLGGAESRQPIAQRDSSVDDDDDSEAPKVPRSAAQESKDIEED
jgi:hypothetical protein